MSARIQELRPEDLTPEQAELRERIAGGRRASGPFRLIEEDGRLTGPFGLMLHSVPVGGALSALGEAIRYESQLSDRIREIAILAVAAAGRHDYEWYAHERVARRIEMTDEEIEALRLGTPLELADSAERVVLDVSRVLADGQDLTDEQTAALSAERGETAAVELLILVGYYTTLAVLMRSLGIGVPEGERSPFE